MIGMYRQPLAQLGAPEVQESADVGWSRAHNAYYVNQSRSIPPSILTDPVPTSGPRR
jgi:hypothetical protein